MLQTSQFRTLGASGIVVSPLGIGTNKWQQDSNDEGVFQAFQAARDAGVNFIDTAEIYTFGKSERLVGSCARRDGRPVIIASKFAPYPTRLTTGQFMRALDASLSRLGVPVLDLYYIHFPFTWLSVERLADMLAQAVAAGKVRAVGVSNFTAEQMRRAAARLARHNIPLAAHEVHYSLAHRHPEVNGVLETCRELDVALVAYRPLSGGRLTVSDTSGAPPQAAALQQTLQAIAQRHGKTTGQVALNWLVRRDPHVIPIPGATSARHAQENADALSWELSDEEFAAIDAASSPKPA
jgi:aryl-alcohol dehydrogenase-like predicted oxidoreductase